MATNWSGKAADGPNVTHRFARWAANVCAIKGLFPRIPTLAVVRIPRVLNESANTSPLVTILTGSTTGLSSGERRDGRADRAMITRIAALVTARFGAWRGFDSHPDKNDRMSRDVHRNDSSALSGQPERLGAVKYGNESDVKVAREPGASQNGGDLAERLGHLEPAARFATRRTRLSSASIARAPVNELAKLTSTSTPGTFGRVAGTLGRMEVAGRIIQLRERALVASQSSEQAIAFNHSRMIPRSSDVLQRSPRFRDGTSPVSASVTGRRPLAATIHPSRFESGGLNNPLAIELRTPGALGPVPTPLSAGAPGYREGFASPAFTGADTSRIVINSSPTIVVHDAQPIGDIETEVLEALRRHAGDLYDQWRREAGRRRRTEF